MAAAAPAPSCSTTVVPTSLDLKSSPTISIEFADVVAHHYAPTSKTYPEALLRRERDWQVWTNVVVIWLAAKTQGVFSFGEAQFALGRGDPIIIGYDPEYLEAKADIEASIRTTADAMKRKKQICKTENCANTKCKSCSTNVSEIVPACGFDAFLDTVVGWFQEKTQGKTVKMNIVNIHERAPDDSDLAKDMLVWVGGSIAPAPGKDKGDWRSALFDALKKADFVGQK